MCNLKIASYNSTGFGNINSKVCSNIYIDNVANKCDILLLQEHWLLEQQLNKVVNLLDGFLGTAVSGVEDKSHILKGRPYGGCVILWESELTLCIEPCQYKSMSRRICGYIVKANEGNVLGLSVSITTDNRSGEIVSSD